MNPRRPGENTPWYRHAWPWLLMAGPLTVIVAGALTVYLAVVSNDGLVDDDYYKQGLAVNQLSARDQEALARGLSAEVLRGDSGLIRVLLHARPDAVLPPSLTLRIAHPTRSGTDQKLILRADGAQSPAYSGTLVAPLAGRWHVSLEDEAKAWRLTGEWLVDKDAVLKLPATP